MQDLGSKLIQNPENIMNDTTTTKPQTAVLIAAAGRGRRFGGEIPKQYATLSGRCVLRRTLDAFRVSALVDVVLCVIHPDDRELYDAALEGLCAGPVRVLDPVWGGETRQDSVRLGLESLAALHPERVLIHDAARPFVNKNVIAAVIEALQTHPAAIAALPLCDTLKRGDDNGLIADTVPRAALWRAQTPQGFHFDEILNAHHRLTDKNLTDDAQLYESLGLSVKLIAGSEDTFKITTKEDLMRGERLLSSLSETRIGSGFDVHRFSDDTGPLMLCGIEIPHSQNLAGHSDADVALHALCDAVLGAIGAGDIGQHFPPSEDTWKDASSDRFVRFAADLVERRGGVIVNVDITIICETPKIAPHRDAMIARVSDILGIETSRVSIKGTTSEGLGFTGRREGIAAHAIIAVRLPY